MELIIIKKIEDYRIEYQKNPKGIFFHFSRVLGPSKVISATALMGDAKSGDLEITFGGNDKKIDIPKTHIVILSNNGSHL